MKLVAKLLAALACAAIGQLQAEDAEVAKEFRTAKSALASQIRSAKSETRLGAIRKLGDFPLIDSAKVLLGQGLTSHDDAVRRAAYQSLLSFKEEREICSFLRQEIEKDFKKADADGGTCAALGVLLASQTPETEKDAEDLLGKAAASKGGVYMLVTLVDELGLQGDETSLGSLLKLTRLPLFSKDYGFRRAVVQALVKIRQPGAVTALVEILGGVQGEVRADILVHLTALAGKQFNDEQACRDWWKTAQATFKFPEKEPLRGAIALKGAPSYYGLPLYGAKMVFVLDTSGSMRGPRIEAAKRELTKAIGEIPDGVQFNVLAFNVRVNPWQAQLVMSSDASKREAAYFVAQQELGPATASYDALEAAMSFPTESIYFLTDGAPAGGKITQPAQIVDVLTKLNKTRRVTINSIGIGVGPEGGAFASFLKTLSAQNYGAYRRVDE